MYAEMETTIRDLLVSSMEDNTIPVKIMEALKTWNCERLKRAERFLVKIDPTIRISVSAGMTSIAWGDRGHSLLVAYVTNNVIVDAEWILDHNQGYFSALVERNESRQKLLQDDALIKNFAKVVIDYRLARAAFGSVVTYDSTGGCGFDHKLRELAGL